MLPNPSASERPLSAAAGVFAGTVGAKIMGAAALVSIFGYLAGVTLNVSRLTFAMAEQGDMPAAFSRISNMSSLAKNGRNKSPYCSGAVVAQDAQDAPAGHLEVDAVQGNVGP